MNWLVLINCAVVIILIPVRIALIRDMPSPRDDDQHEERNQYARQEYEVQKPRYAQRHLHVDIRTNLTKRRKDRQQADDENRNKRIEQLSHGYELSASSFSISAVRSPSSVWPGRIVRTLPTASTRKVHGSPLTPHSTHTLLFLYPST